MTRRQFTVPFAESGTKLSIPTPAQGDGSVSLTEGFTYDYERELGADSDAKSINRAQTNALFNEITSSIGEIQQYGMAIWSADGAPYDIFATVRHLGRSWTSNITSNNSEPGADGNWSDSSFGISVLQFATDATLVAGTPIGSAAITDWTPFVGRTVITLRNNSTWPPSSASYNVQTFIISTSTPSSGVGTVHYNLGGGHYAIRSAQGGGTRIDWFEDSTSAPAMSAFSAFNVAGFSPRVPHSNLITVTSTASTYTVPYWDDGLTIEFEPATTASITVTPTSGNSKSVTFVLKNENVTLTLTGAGTFRGTGQRITALAIGTSGEWVLQSAGSYYHPDGIIGDPLEFTAAGLNVTVGPTGSGATVIWDALDGLENVKTFFINAYVYGISLASTETGLCSVTCSVASTVIDSGTPEMVAAITYKNELISVEQLASVNTFPVPNANNGVLYTRVSTTEPLDSPNGSVSVKLRLIGYEY